MQLGFITSALAGRSLTDIATWGKAEGMAFMEVGPHAPLDEVRAYLEDAPPVEVRALLYCRNIRHPDEGKRLEFVAQTEARLDLARECGVPMVNISTGVDPSIPLKANVAACAEMLTRLCERAGEGVVVAVENCPDTGNIAVNADIWGELLARVAAPNFRLTYDPSHLVRLLAEPYGPIYEFGPRIAHVHAKDTEVIATTLARQGISGEGWWRYRVPGWGQTDWRQVITRLHEIGFEGGVSLEHEDPLFEGRADGTVASLTGGEAGLRAGAAHLRPLLEQVYGRL